MPKPDEPISVEERLRTLEGMEKRLRRLAQRRGNPFEDLAIQLALENGGTASARVRMVNMPLGSMLASVGAPTFGETGGNTVWAFDDAAANESVVGAIQVPEDYVSGGAWRLFYYMASAVAGAVAWTLYTLSLTEGEAITGVNTGDAVVVFDGVQGTSNWLGIKDFISGATFAAGDWLRVQVRRSGANGSDTAVGDALMVGLAFRYNAFF